MQYRIIFVASLAFATNVYAIPKAQVTQAPRAEEVAKRAQPDAAGSSVLDAPMTIKAGESFDGGNVMYDRGKSCTGQEEGGDSDAVFILEAGASISNVIIGPNQSEGIHCFGSCSVSNVWWDAVCEDAFTIKEQDDGQTTTISGGGAKGAEDKVIQHNGGGTVVIQDFTVSDFGKMYRSCGNCKSMPARHVQVTGGSATDGKVLVGINPNMGDTASISGISLSGVKKECVTYKGVTDGSEPEEVGTCSGDGSSNGGSSSGGDNSSDDDSKNDDSKDDDKSKDDDSKDDDDSSDDDKESSEESQNGGWSWKRFFW